MSGEYEYEERAAIRQFDGGCERLVAEGAAHDDMAERADEQGRLAVLRAGSELEALAIERSQIQREWLAETDAQRNAELRRRWQDLSMQIAALKVQGA